MIHQPSGGAKGQAADIEIQARLILDLRKRLNAIYAQNTGQKLSVIEKAMDRDNFMTPQEALDFGLIDHIITKKKTRIKKRKIYYIARSAAKARKKSKNWLPAEVCIFVMSV